MFAYERDSQELRKDRYLDNHVGKANLIIRLPPELISTKKAKMLSRFE